MSLFTSYEEWLSASIWWEPGFLSLGPLFSKTKATALSKRGLQWIRDIWDSGSNQFLSNDIIAEWFGLLPHEFDVWNTLCNRLLMQGQRFLIQRSPRPIKEEWIGLYVSPGDHVPRWVTQGGLIPAAHINSQVQVLHIPAGTELFSIQQTSWTLSPMTVPWSEDAAVFVDRVRIVQVVRGPRKNKILLFYGWIRELT
jgi:hypothetical protein